MGNCADQLPSDPVPSRHASSRDVEFVLKLVGERSLAACGPPASTSYLTPSIRELRCPHTLHLRVDAPRAMAGARHREAPAWCPCVGPLCCRRRPTHAPHFSNCGVEVRVTLESVSRFERKPRCATFPPRRVAGVAAHVDPDVVGPVRRDARRVCAVLPAHLTRVRVVIPSGFPLQIGHEERSIRPSIVVVHSPNLHAATRRMT